MGGRRWEEGGVKGGQRKKEISFSTQSLGSSLFSPPSSLLSPPSSSLLFLLSSSLLLPPPPSSSLFLLLSPPSSSLPHRLDSELELIHTQQTELEDILSGLEEGLRRQPPTAGHHADLERTRTYVCNATWPYKHTSNCFVAPVVTVFKPTMTVNSLH